MLCAFICPALALSTFAVNIYLYICNINIYLYIYISQNIFHTWHIRSGSQFSVFLNLPDSFSSSSSDKTIIFLILYSAITDLKISLWTARNVAQKNFVVTWRPCWMCIFYNTSLPVWKSHFFDRIRLHTGTTPLPVKHSQTSSLPVEEVGLPNRKWRHNQIWELFLCSVTDGS